MGLFKYPPAPYKGRHLEDLKYAFTSSDYLLEAYALDQEGLVEACQRELMLPNPAVEIRVLMAEALYDLGRIDESYAALAEVLRQEPGYFNAQAFIGRIHLARGDVQEAIYSLGLAVQLEPLYSWALPLYSVALKRADRLRESQQAYLRAIETSIRKNPTDAINRWVQKTERERMDDT